jgi:beta-lactamase superfamily II metal-dependent hydrolase
VRKSDEQLIFNNQGVNNDFLPVISRKIFANWKFRHKNYCIFHLNKPELINSRKNEASTMARIRDLVQEALATGYLTVEAEDRLRQLLTTRYDLEDFNAFMALQEAAMTGKVKQQSRERCGIK